MEKLNILSSDQAVLYKESVLGGKAKNLAWLTRNKLPVPDWFVVTTDAFNKQLVENNLDEWLQQQMNDVNSESDQISIISKRVQEKISLTKLHSDIRDELEKALEPIENWEKTFFAVRSSAVGEDSADASFAGQLDSFLFQKGIDAISASIVNCFASAFTERAIRYRLYHKMDLTDIRAAVIVQKMVDGEVSGVCFTAHPITGSRRHGLISACFGIGEGIVSGVCNTDEFTVELAGDTIEAGINNKDKQVIFDTASGLGTIEADVPQAMQKTACLSDADIHKIRKLGLEISQHLKSPQDIEWTIKEGKVYILQTRPVTSLPPSKEPAGETIVWDNSNIQESYCGVTTPLTFSFASRAYAIVYEQTLRLLDVTPSTMPEMKDVCRNMLGLIRGRIYYNINNWYRGLLVLPSFKTNKEDMERMMGLQDPVDFVEDKQLNLFGKMKKLPGMLRTMIKLMTRLIKFDKKVIAFKEMFEREYEKIHRSELHMLEISELMDLTTQLKLNLLYNWQTPILNDFYVMMMNGRVYRWLENAKIEQIDVTQNNLMSGEEGIESTEPTKFLLKMCAALREKPILLELFEKTENNQLMGAIQAADTEFYETCCDYIELYGDRCMGELKLESVTLRQDPSFLFAILKNFIKKKDLTIDTLAVNEQKFRTEAEDLVFNTILSKFGNRKLGKFKKDLAKLRQSVKNRENMRLARTRMFGLFRDIYVEIGNQLAFYGLLDNADDIFYITVEELEAYMEGRSVQSLFKPLVEVRRAEYQTYHDRDLPHHFSTIGAVYHHNSYTYENAVEINESAEVLNGIGCYPGVVEEKVKLIFSPDDELDLDGQILCTVRTDPGWAPLFPTAGGIIVERGSTLSHSAVVARELGIPAIVNVPGLTQIIKNGETIRMDGSAGTITRLDDIDSTPDK